MKQPNWRLFFLLNDIKLGISILALIGIVIFSLLIFDNAFPIFKYSVLCLKIVTWICLILSLAILLVMIRKARKERFCSFLNRRKIVYSLSYLSLSLTFLFSIEYLIYIDNKESFNIENGYIKESLIDKVNTMHENIAYCEGYIHEYNKVLINIKSYSYIHYINSNDSFYIIICSDTIQLRLHRKVNPSGGGIIHNRFEKRKRLFDGVREVGISLNNESYNLSHPSNNAILESMESSDSINANLLRQLIKDKIKFYSKRITSYNKVLNNELTISFWDFVIYNIFNPSITGNKTHIFIRLIFLLQAIVLTFFSGYIYQTLYKILDGEENKKPEA